MSDRDLAEVLALVDRLGPALERNDRVQLNEVVAGLVALRAPMGEQWQQLAMIAAGNGEMALSRKAIDLLVESLGGGPMAQYRKVTFLALMDQWRESDALLQTLPEGVPDTVSNAYSRGACALNLGRLDEARAYLEKVTRLRPQSGYAWFSLSMAANLGRAPDIADRLIAAEPGMERADLTERVPYLYALGKTHAERGDHARAFDAFARGARLMKSSLAYDAAADRANADDALAGYSAERIAAIAGRQSEATARTIFVMGLPRSGTTLIEQILTSHSAVTDGGEISRLMLLSGETGGPSWSALARYVEANGGASAVHLWHHWLDELYPGSGRVVDKSVTTSRFLGLAAALLPQAPLIWVTRDPLDRAWSCFRTNFAGTAMPWSYDLADIAAHFRIEDQLMSQWQQILGDRLLAVPYEALVTDPEPWIRRILAHCGLEEEPGVFAPHENARAVPTASMAQVRRPINRDGIGAAEPYRQYLQPFIEAYGD